MPPNRRHTDEGNDFNVSLPALPGRFDTAALIGVYGLWQPRVHDRLNPDGQFQHSIGVKGWSLIRDDSAVVMISPTMYAELIRPFNDRLADALGGVGVHFCGKGQSQITFWIPAGSRVWISAKPT